MNIIIVAKSNATPTTLDLKCWRARGKIGGIIAAIAFLCVGLGFIAARLLTGSGESALREVNSMRETIAQQRQTLAQIETSSRRDMDALAPPSLVSCRRRQRA